ncbi:hypothetical protein M434DRAFT_397194 [Hypoxylon sp. CO27-5]|nr:hypothetical protein M434DRAFT_397194 [Hypoxylon sp. CO27-5]
MATNATTAAPTPSPSALLHAKLDGLYDVWMSLKPNSPEADFARFGSYFDENCKAYLLSMREIDEPSVGRQAVIEKIKEVLQNTRIKQRNVLGRFDVTWGGKVAVEMYNHIEVGGIYLIPFPEIAVVTFNDENLITDFKLYCCRSPVVHIIQAATGYGPYKSVSPQCH